MKHIYEDEKGATNFDKYFAYIQNLKEKLPEAVYKYAATEEHYDLTSHSSLHDAWLEYCTFSEPSSGARNEIRESKVECCFFGPFHDKKLILKYKKVSNYRVNAINTSDGLGDLNVHEFSLNADNTISHELSFINGSVINITFKEFEYREENV